MDELGAAQASPFRCEDCGKDFADHRAIAGHNRMKHPLKGTVQTPATVAADAKRRKYKDYPYRSSGVNENANLRMVMMVQPLCPIPVTFSSISPRSAFDELFPEYIGQESCQAGRYYVGWWNDCEARGHNPYYSTRRRVGQRNTFDAEGNLIGKSEHLIEDPGPNVVPVAISPRHNSGMEVPDNLKRGFKMLTDLGYPPICEMRGCDNTVQLKTRFGSFCNERHARLVAADAKKIYLAVKPDTELSKWREDREEQLNDIELGKIEYV